jgi:hypothetical protein
MNMERQLKGNTTKTSILLEKVTMNVHLAKRKITLKDLYVQKVGKTKR